MIYKEFAPDKLLTDVIKSYWWFDNSTRDKLEFTILPDGYFDLIISFDNYQQQEISLTGLWTRQVDICIGPDTQLFGIRFKLLAVDYILKEKISTILDREKILDNDFWQLDSASFKDLDSVTNDLDQIMLSILSGQDRIDDRLLKLCDLLYRTNGEWKVEAYSQAVFWNSRQINRYFQDRFGIPLKSYCKILKCFASFTHVKKGQLFPSQNYYDQSHFIKDLKKITGKSPTELFENKNDRFLQLVTMKEK